ncbi:type II toxin-antitoxin system VapC family toxin [soil metagenome]
MLAVDTNVLVFAEIESSAHHEAASDLLTVLAESPHPWALPWPCVYEFLRVVTHPRVYHPAVPRTTALADLERILASPSLILLGETDRHPLIMRDVLDQSGATGNLVHDAHIAALCIEHGISKLLTGDRDFARFSGLSVVDPFVE